MCASDDRYADDVHYVGGCVLGVDMLPWAATMLTLCAQPPDPAAVGDGWRDTWLERMKRTPADGRGLALAPAPRRLLAPGLGVRGLRRDRGARLRGGRLGGRLLQRRPAPDGGAARTAQGTGRPVVARVPAGRRARARRSASSRSACAGGIAGSRAIDTKITDEPALRVWMQDSVEPADQYTPSGRGAGSPSRPGRRPSVENQERPLPGDYPRQPLQRRVHGRGRRRVVPGRRLRGLAARPARRGRALADASLRAARASRSRSSASRRSSWRCRPTGRARSWRCACARSRPRARRCSSPAACSTSPTATAMPRRGRSSRDAATTSASASTRSPRPYRPAIACACRSRRPTGPGPGPRPSRSR